MRLALLLLLAGCQSSFIDRYIGDEVSFGEFVGVSGDAGRHWRGALKKPTRNITALSLGAAAALLQIDDTDERWQREIKRQGWMPGDQENKGSDIGSWLLVVGGGVAPFFFPPHPEDGHARRRYVATAMHAIIANTGTNVLVRTLVDRRRPSGSNGSFYSGHTTAAFTGAQLLQRFYGPKVGVPAYILGATVAWYRIEADRHYPSDVLVGAAMGIFLTDLIYEKNFGPDGLYSTTNAELVPLLSDSERGLALRWSW